MLVVLCLISRSVTYNVFLTISLISSILIIIINTRQNNKLCCLSFHSSFGQRCILYNGVTFWNDFHNKISINCPYRCYKKSLKQSILLNHFNLQQ